MALFAQAPVSGGYALHVLPVMILLATGIGVSFPALMTVAMSGATREDAGLASGLVNTTAQVGGALGLAVLATVAASRTGDLAAAGKVGAAALTGGYHLAFWIGAGVVAVALVIALLVVRPGERPAPALEGEEPWGAEPAYSEVA